MLDEDEEDEEDGDDAHVTSSPNEVSLWRLEAAQKTRGPSGLPCMVQGTPASKSGENRGTNSEADRFGKLTPMAIARFAPEQLET